MRTRQRGRLRVAAAGAALGLLAVAGCGTDQPTEPPTTPVESAASSPSPSPTVSLRRLPEPPEAMGEPSKEGAVAAATYVLALYGYSFASADLGPWRQITAETCEFCREVSAAVTRMVEEGQTSSGSTFTVVSATSTQIAEGQWYTADMEIVQGASERMDEDGVVVSSDDGGRYRAFFALSWSDGWQVDEMGVDPVGEGAEDSA